MLTSSLITLVVSAADAVADSAKGAAAIFGANAVASRDTTISRSSTALAAIAASKGLHAVSVAQVDPNGSTDKMCAISLETEAMIYRHKTA